MGIADEPYAVTPSVDHHRGHHPELQPCEIWHAARGIWHGPRDFAGGSPLRDFVPSGVSLVLAWPRFVQLPDPRPRHSRHLPIDTTIKSLDPNFEVAPANKVQGAQRSTLSLLPKPQLALNVEAEAGQPPCEIRDDGGI